MSNESILFWYRFAMWCVAVPATVFPILYTVWFRWWESTLGRALFVKSLALAIVIDISLGGVVWGWFYPELSIGLLFALSAAIVYQQYAMFRVKMSSRKHNLDGVPERGHEEEAEAERKNDA